jgi:hypothetical protein
MEMRKKSSRGYWWLFLFGVVIGVAFAIFNIQLKKREAANNGAPSPSPMSSEKLSDIVHRARVAVGHLENDRFADADEILVALTPEVPDEPIVARNLMIARLRLFEDGKVDEAQVNQAFESLKKTEAGAASTHWMSAKIKLKQAELATTDERRAELSSLAIGDLERATGIEPQSVVYAFQLYWHSHFLSDEALIKKGVDSLKKAFQLQPDNLFILTELLATQTKDQEPAIVDTIAQAKKVLGPLASSIETRTRINVLKMLDQAVTAAAAKNWGVVRQNTAPLMGVVRSEEISRSDLRRVDVNPLEFVVHEFSPRFRDQHPFEMPTPPQIPIEFRIAELGETAASMTDVLDAKVADFDLNDKPDLLILRPGKLEVFEFAEQGRIGSLLSSVEVPASMSHVLIADLDQDTIPKTTPTGQSPNAVQAEAAPQDLRQKCFQADGDIVVYGSQGFVILRNELPPQDAADQPKQNQNQSQIRKLEPIAEQPSVDANVAKVPIHSAILVDMDHDGDLDIVAATEKGVRLWSNRGQLLFEDLTSYSTLPPADVRFDTLSIVDFDRDVDVDIFLSGTQATQIGYLESLRHGQFRWQPLRERFANLSSSLAVVPLEADGSASWDLATAGQWGVQIALTKTAPAQSVMPIQDVIASRTAFEHLLAADFDNDGWRDVLAWNANSASLMRGKGAGGFIEDAKAFAALPAGVQHCEPADTDADGDIDLVCVANRKLMHLVNQSGSHSAYLTIHAHGDEDNRSGRVNHWGIGSLVELKAGGMYQAQTITSDATHFGLGSIKQADIVRILWTQGIPQAMIAPAANQIVCEPMVLKGSCPYVYTWTGSKFEFFTDLLWAAPLGLQLADGVIAPDRPWEYLKIPGERLQQQGGAYELQITEELWEAAYFDQVELLAVDHPESIEIFSNEKVGPPAIADFHIHTVRQRRPLNTAFDQRGRDLLPKLAKADGDMAKAFDTTFRQGLAESHYLEFDFGKLNSPSRVTLFLTGWIRPTDTSLNVALTHDPELKLPRPPSIWAPAPNGEWHEVVPFMGFPGGKTKTIAMDVTKLFSGHDYRLRVVGSAEIYWDEAFFTVDEEPGTVEIVPLKLLAADLHYRGFSASFPGPRELPETYDYASVDPSPRWPPMQGRFTRYGNVRELLMNADAHLVVMGSGDEMTVRFDMPDEPRPGWKRDFILHNVGWDKDADVNTVFGQTVEPLPYIGMEAYPYVDSHQLENEGYRRYLRAYQTREMDRNRFWKFKEEDIKDVQDE